MNPPLPASRPSPWPARWTPLLAPLCLLYGAAVRARAWCYGRGFLRTRSLEAPVVSVGNLAAGGSGKTPLVEFLARQAQAAGLRPAVLTRGYGRRGASDLIRVRGPGSGATPAALGDEPCWLAERNPELTICIGRSRHAAGRLAQITDAPDLFLLDDGFQHLALARQLNLLLIDAGRGLGNGRVLPCGWLREPVAAARRADAVILTQANLGDADAVVRDLRRRLGALPPLFRFGYAPRRLTRLDGGAELPPGALAGQTVSLVCAIARPEGFAATVRALGAEAREVLARPDHDPYDAAALAELERRLADVPVTGLAAGPAAGPETGTAGAPETGTAAWVTTEKDAVKLRGRLAAADRLWVLEMGIEPDPAWAAFFTAFLNRHGLARHGLAKRS